MISEVFSNLDDSLIPRSSPDQSLCRGSRPRQHRGTLLSSSELSGRATDPHLHLSHPPALSKLGVCRSSSVEFSSPYGLEHVATTRRAPKLCGVTNDGEPSPSEASPRALPSRREAEDAARRLRQEQGTKRARCPRMPAYVVFQVAEPDGSVGARRKNGGKANTGTKN